MLCNIVIIRSILYGEIFSDGYLFAVSLKREKEEK